MTPLSLAPAAFLAGILMFLAPCTLPIVPAYLAFIAGVPEGASYAGARGRVIRNALAFIVGFTLVFVTLGVFASLAGMLVGAWRPLLARTAGVILFFFGVTMLGARLPFISQEWHARIPKMLALGRPQSALLIGMLFAFGWSPCIGPVLGTVLFLASSSATMVRGAWLLLLFSLGLAVPFLLSALFIGRVQRLVTRLSALSSALYMIGGIILMAVGLLMALGDIGILTTVWYNIFGSWGYDALLSHL